eukprot:3256417-Pyramimonas_sp.AAC.1
MNDRETEPAPSHSVEPGESCDTRKLPRAWRCLIGQSSRIGMVDSRGHSCPLLGAFRNPFRNFYPWGAGIEYSHDGPIGRKKCGYILTADQSDAHLDGTVDGR